MLLVAAGSGGALYFLAFVGFGVWPLLAVFLVPLFWAVERAARQGLARAAAAGLAFGLVAHTGGHLWLWRLVDVFLGGDVLLGGLLWSAHALWFAAGFAAYAVVLALLLRAGVALPVAGTAPLLVLEWLQPQLFPVFAGSALIDRVALVQVADLGGPLLLSALVALVNACGYRIYTAWRGAGPRPTALLGVTLALVLAAWSYGVLRLRDLDERLARAATLEVGIVQANLGVLEKRAQAREAHQLHLASSRTLLDRGPLDLLVWPETAQLRAIRGPLPVSGRLVRGNLEVPLLFGGTLVRQAQGGGLARANAALLVAGDGMIREAYEKNLLIPLAEFVPFGDWLPGLAEQLPHAQDFVAADRTPALHLGDAPVATPICYEIVRPAFVRRMLRESDAQLLVTLANDAWFGDSQEPWIHLQLARMRAIEHRRFLVRATNSGISAIVDPAGRVVARTGLLTRETLRGRVAPWTDVTLYRRWGDWPGWVALAVLLASLGLAISRRGTPPATRR